ncbi:MAG TPA: hypothetical protein EYP61_03580 [Candidatus Latescibacteria bacterium]|nr:hypothetical protein [Candidatus Latescibacterota bacterium]
MEVNEVGPERIPELKRPSSFQNGRTSKVGKPDREDKVSISNEAKLLQRVREVVRARSPDLRKVLRRLREGYYDREDVIREVARKILSDLFGSMG